MLEILLKSEIFEGFNKSEVRSIIQNTPYHINKYFKGDNVYKPYEPITHTAIILSGAVDLIYYSYDGKESLVLRRYAGESIGESYNISGTENSEIFFRTANDSELLFMDLNKIMTSYLDNPCYIHLLRNINQLLAHTNLTLNKKIQFIAQKTLQDKLITYFKYLKNSSQHSSFKLPLNREQLANYLCAERSAVSRELSRMQDKKIIRIDSDTITLLTE